MGVAAGDVPRVVGAIIVREGVTKRVGRGGRVEPPALVEVREACDVVTEICGRLTPQAEINAKSRQKSSKFQAVFLKMGLDASPIFHRCPGLRMVIFYLHEVLIHFCWKKFLLIITDTSIKVVSYGIAGLEQDIGKKDTLSDAMLVLVRPASHREKHRIG